MLRERTASSHAEVELALDLLAPALTTARLAEVVARLHAFFAATEPALDRWAIAEPSVATRLDWPRRRRSDVVAADLVTLGVPALPLPAPVFDTVGTARALGWLYVVEGSTLGGAIIARRTATLTDRLAAPLRTFTPYSDGPGPMWRAFGATADEWVDGDDGRTRAVADAAAAVFESLARWVAPPGDEVAA